LATLCQSLSRVSEKIPLVFPVHPRTRKNLIQAGLIDVLNEFSNIILLEPLNYIRFMNLVFNCRFVVTDSGGIQEETTYLKIPCLTMRPNTERPITVTHGTNTLCSLEDLEEKVEIVLCSENSVKCDIELWDGKTSIRVAEFIHQKAVYFEDLMEKI
jgi:UDP-N-acetylglucosamine 2-epimerase (non-hydrolysing)